jgi:hypothetical protein
MGMCMLVLHLVLVMGMVRVLAAMLVVRHWIVSFVGSLVALLAARYQKTWRYEEVFIYD